MAILYDAGRLKPIAYDHLWLSDTPRLIGSATWGNTVVRMLTWVRFLDNRTGNEFVHLNTHFDHQSEESRVRSAQLVRDVVAEFDVPTIVTGDFNSPHETSESYQILVTEGGLRDTWVDAAQRLTPEYQTANAWQPPVEGGPRIDWVLCTEGATFAKTAINTGPGDDLYPSDHWPVQTLLRLP